MNTTTTTMTIRILIEDREYSKWSYQDADTNQDIPTPFELKEISPLTEKWFTKDVIQIQEQEQEQEETKTEGRHRQQQLIYSPTRIHKKHAGILILQDGKTYGRTENHKRLLYKCIPDDKRLPVFLVPYEIKMGFHKTIPNKYVLFSVMEWKDKHPRGQIEETLGNVDHLEAFYEYQLYSKCIHTSITEMTKEARKAINRKPIQESMDQIKKNKTFHIHDRTQDIVFTIDPQSSLDYDDGFSIQDLPNSTKKRVSVYIANVYVWLETLGLWKSFSQRVATIYLPDYRRPMLPTILSESLCSLQQGEQRFVFIMDIDVDEDGSFGEPVFSNAEIKVSKNYVYEEKALLGDKTYCALFDLTFKLDSSILNSHDVVAYWMIQMNTQCAYVLAKHQTGIFRAMNYMNTMNDGFAEGESTLSPNEKRVIKLYNKGNNVDKYVYYTEGCDESYAQVTSPIRRLVDLLNYIKMMYVVEKQGMSAECLEFVDMWLSKMDYINTTMRMIRKVEMNCDLMTKCIRDPVLIQQEHTGLLFDGMKKTEGIYTYMVYVESIKLLTRVTLRNEYANYSKQVFKMFVFEDEYKTRKKILLQCLQ